MAIRKRKTIWWIDFVSPSGERVRRSTETQDKALAEELHDRLKGDVWRLEKIGDKRRRTWQEAVVRWLKEQAHKATHEEDKAKLRWLDRHLAGKELDTINRAMVDRITEAKLAGGCSNATVNRTLALLRAILRRAHRDWEWLDTAPAIRLLKEASRRIRFLTLDQAHRLLDELPPHLADMATFTLSTGLRAANVTGLTWQQVDPDRKLARVHPDQAKGRRATPVPSNESALRTLEKQIGKHPTIVFTYSGCSIERVSTAAWYKALKRAGIADFKWHDLRHTWANRAVQSGVPLFALQEMAGWETPGMARRYAHLASGHLPAHADMMPSVHGTNLAQGQKRQGASQR